MNWAGPWDSSMYMWTTACILKTCTHYNDLQKVLGHGYFWQVFLCIWQQNLPPKVQTEICCKNKCKQKRGSGCPLSHFEWITLFWFWFVFLNYKSSLGMGMRFNLFLVSHGMLDKYFWVPVGSMAALTVLGSNKTCWWKIINLLLNHQLFFSSRTLLMDYVLETSAQSFRKFKNWRCDAFISCRNEGTLL